MAILRTDIERALDELASQEEGMRFQGLAIVLGKMRWPELIARQRKKDSGLDAYAPSSLTQEKIGKGLAASITPTLKKVSDDAETAKKSFPDLKMLLFVTSEKVGNADRKRWENEIRKEHKLELHILEREEIITLMTMPKNASLCASYLHIQTEAEPQVSDLIERTKRAASELSERWANKTQGQPLIDLMSVRIEPNGEESTEVLSLEQMDQALSQSRRIVLEGPAGRGKTTTLIQLAQLRRTVGIPIIVELSAWTSSKKEILDYIARMPSFQAEGLTPHDLARVHNREPLLLLLNGWNEIAESNSEHSNDALRALERDFPKAGIIVATRTHHLSPPVPGALRLRLLRLQRAQRAAYLIARLGAKSSDLRAIIERDPSLDELTRSPFILSEVASLFELGSDIPSTKISILAEVLRLQELRDEHRNALQVAPIFGRQTDYLKRLATEMTRRGTVELHDDDARTVTTIVTQELVSLGQIECVGAPAVLTTLTAHHVLERIDYPQTAFQFEHQQFQEYYVTLDLLTLLLGLQDDDHDAFRSFTSDYVNDPAWAEPIRMIAETFAEQTGDTETDEKNTRAGCKLVEMALTVDPVFAGEIAHYCGVVVWNEVRTIVSEHIRAIYSVRDGAYKQYALAAMLATSSDDFSDIIVPLLSGEDQQTRLKTYRLWPDFHVSSLGSNWFDVVRSWDDEARADFVSELLHHRIDDEVAALAVEDNSVTVKMRAADSLMWIRSDDALTNVFESMDTQTFEEAACKYADDMPAILKPKTIAAMRKLIESTTDNHTRLRTALDLIEQGETDLDNVVKDALSALPSGDVRSLSSHQVQPAVEYLRTIDPAWMSEWIAVQIADGILHDHDYWLPFATTIPDSLSEQYLQHLETEEFKDSSFSGMIAVIAAHPDAELAARVFSQLRELQRKVDGEPGVRHEFEWQVMRQLKAVFHRLPDDIVAAGILSSVTSGEPLDIKVTADLLTKVAMSDVDPLCIANDDLRANLRAYLKESVDVVLSQDDFNGQEKANLASSIAQVGNPDDMADLVTLIHADIERVRCGRAARMAGDRGPIGNGGAMDYSDWHINAIMQLDVACAEQVLIDLLTEQEYRNSVAAAMARDFALKQESTFDRTLRYDLMWDAREGRAPQPDDDQRRTRFADALLNEIRHLREKDAEPAYGLKELAYALSTVDAHGSAAEIIDVIAMPGQWNQYIRLYTAERLLMAGVILPATAAFALVDSISERTERNSQESERNLLRRTLTLCPFIDDPVAGIAKMREVLGKQRLLSYELRDVVDALGESRTDVAVDLLFELATDERTLEQCEDNFINAFATLDTPRARNLLLSYVDPNIRSITLTHRPHHEDLLVVRLTELSQRIPELVARFQELCEHDLPESNRRILSKVMTWIGTPEALIANLNLIDDDNPSPVPRGIWEQLESAFIERRPYEKSSDIYTIHSRASNDLRTRLFSMALQDQKRQKSANMLLGEIEVWRLEHGRPTDEPRHPDLASNQSWPPI